jgi:hypothetical protein
MLVAKDLAPTSQRCDSRNRMYNQLRITRTTFTLSFFHVGHTHLTIHAWNTDKEGTNSFDCEYNDELYGYFVRAEAIPSLLLIDPKATWNQELENVYLVSCESRDNYQHYEYELRPDCYP